MPKRNNNNAPKAKNVKARRRRNRRRRNQLTRFAPSLGESIGGYFGPIGARIGKGVGRFLGSVTGFGDYKVNSNSLMQNQVPVFASAHEVTTIKHREFIRDINGTVNFTLQSFPINPGMRATFPWLSNVAKNYDQYRFRGVLFEFKTTSGTAVGSTNTALGTVIMATDYNAEEGLFPSKQSMEASQFACSSVPSMSLIHPIECAVTQTVLPLNYVRSEPPSSTEDLRLYDLGNFQIATTGMQSGVTTIGELWVSYDVELYKPVIETTTLFHYAHVVEDAKGTATAAAPLGSAGRYISGTVEVSPITGAAFGLPNIGTYIVCVDCKGGTLSSQIGLSSGANIVAGSNIFSGQSTTFIRAQDATSAIYFSVCQVTNNGYTSANLTTIAGPTGLTSGNTDVLIFEVPSSIAYSKEKLLQYFNHFKDDFDEKKSFTSLVFP